MRSHASLSLISSVRSRVYGSGCWGGLCYMDLELLHRSQHGEDMLHTETLGRNEPQKGLKVHISYRNA